MRTLFPILPLCLAAAACTQTPAETARGLQDEAATQARLDQRLAGLVPGEPLNCLPQFQRTQTSGYGRTILYTVGRDLVYRNDTSGGCDGLSRDDIIISRPLTSQTCQGDILRLVDRTIGTPTGSCSLGKFVPYRRPR